MFGNLVSILLPEFLYVIIFVLSPIGLLFFLWQHRKIQTLKILLFLGGLFLSIGILSFYFFAKHVAFSPFIFTIINHPLFVFLILINKYLNINLDYLFIVAFTVLPFFVYPPLGLFVGAMLDKYMRKAINKRDR